MQPTLVILAAGMGSRYGGMKQLEAFGPGGGTIMDYSLFDARRAGFGRVVFVIRPEMEAAFRAQVGSRYERRLPVAYAFQRLEDVPTGVSVPPERTKPWGTGHAVLAAAGQVDGPFSVVNADDFYGRQAFEALAAHFREESPRAATPVHAMVGYRLADTVTAEGTVNRGCCRTDDDGWLREIVEVEKIEKAGADGRYPGADGRPVTLSGDTIVSMNMWGFQPALFDELRGAFESFLRSSADLTKGELYLPTVVQNAMKAGRARVRVLKTSSRWCGVTNRGDREQVMAMLKSLTDAGEYPAVLWG